MKKLFFAMFAFALCMGMTSCKDSANKDKNDSTKTEASADNKGGEKGDNAKTNNDENEAKAPATDTSSIEATLNDILTKAKAEGANWSIDDWKAQLKAAMVACKPMFVEMKNMQDKIKADPSKAAEAMKDAETNLAKYEKVGSIVEEIGNIAEQTENGKQVSEDKDFEKSVMKELGLGDLDM